jgi:hypothetical protein
MNLAACRIESGWGSDHEATKLFDGFETFAHTVP